MFDLNNIVYLKLYLNTLPSKREEKCMGSYRIFERTVRIPRLPLILI